MPLSAKVTAGASVAALMACAAYALYSRRSAKRCSLYFVAVGDFQGACSGGYEYGRRLVRGLRELGVSVEVVELAPSHPFLSGFPGYNSTRPRKTEELFSRIPPGSKVILDGLAVMEVWDMFEKFRMIHELIPLIHYPTCAELDTTEELRKLCREHEAVVFAHAPLLLAASSISANLLKDIFAVPEERIVVGEPGVCPRLFRPLPPADRKAARTDAAIHLLCPSNGLPRKNQSFIVECLGKLRTSKHPWVLRFVGNFSCNASYTRDLKHLIRTLGLEESVEFVSEMSQTELVNQYKWADVLLFSSLFENWGMVLAEAVATGLPCITTNVGCAPLLCKAPSCAVVDVGDEDGFSAALARVLDGEELQRMQMAAYEEAKKGGGFTWSRLAGKVAVALGLE